MVNNSSFVDVFKIVNIVGLYIHAEVWLVASNYRRTYVFGYSREYIVLL